MTIDSVTQLREWGHGIERALNISLNIDHNGVLALGSRAGHLLGIGPIPGQAALIFTGLIGVADDTMRADTLCALLAANMDPRWSGSGSIAAVPQTREIVYRLIWAPDEPHWTESVFVAVLEAFAKHVDVLATAVANREIEQILMVATSANAAADHAPTSTDLV